MEITSGVQVNYAVADWLSLHSNVLVFHQQYAHWDGVRDVNTGLISTSGLFGARIDAGKGVSLGLDVRVPFSQRTLLRLGDTFEEGPVFLLTTSYTF